MPGGIDQLVDTYKGNPQPLQAKVQRAQGQLQNQMKQQAQQGQPPGAIPPDLEEALALQQIAELQQGAQNQQAIQAGGAQPSVVDKLRQMLAGNQAQAQMAGGPPVMAAQGGSIDQLMSNLGQNYAGGGIVAFQSAGSVKDPNVEDEDKKPLEPYTLQQQGAAYVARKQAERAAKEAAESPNKESLPQFIQDIAKFPEMFDAWKQRAREQSAVDAAQNQRMEKYKQDKLAAQQKTSLANYLVGSPEREKEGLEKLAELSNAPLPKTAEKLAATPSGSAAPSLSDIRGQLNVADAARFAEKPAPKPPVPTANASAAPRPPTANAGIGGGPAAPAKPAEEAMSPMEAALQKSIMEALAKDPEEIRRKAIEANAKAMGLDALLKPGQERAANREARIKEIQAERQPLWITALQNAGNKPGNIAQVLNQMATGVSTTKQGYNTQDLKFLEELDALHAINDKARIEGRYKDLAAGEAAVKDLISEKKQAEQSGTSLLNTTAVNKSREQIAKDAAAGRAQSASQHNAQMALALEEKKRQFNESELRKIREKDVDRAAKIETAIAKRTAMIDMQLQNPKLKPEDEAALQARRNAIVKQVQAEYPSVKPEKPTESQFLAAARAANPGVSDADLKAYYKQNYGT